MFHANHSNIAFNRTEKYFYLHQYTQRQVYTYTHVISNEICIKYSSSIAKDLYLTESLLLSPPFIPCRRHHQRKRELSKTYSRGEELRKLRCVRDSRHVVVTNVIKGDSSRLCSCVHTIERRMHVNKQVYEMMIEIFICMECVENGRGTTNRQRIKGGEVGEEEEGLEYFSF